MDYDLIVVKTLERVYKNYYYIIRGENVLMMMSFKDAQNYKVLWSDFTMVSRFRKNIGKESH